MEWIGKITVWLSKIPIFLIPFYIIIRVLFTFTPVFSRYLYEEKILWYKGMNKNKFILIVILSLIILLSASILRSDIHQNSGNRYIATLSIGLIQVYLLYFIEKKLSYSLKDTFKVWYKMLKTNASSAYEAEEFTKIDNLSIGNELPFKLRRHFKEVQFEEIQDKFGIHIDSKYDVNRLLSGLPPQNPIIFTQKHRGSIVKKRVVLFFLFCFELYDQKNHHWLYSLNEIKSFQEEHTKFHTDDRDYRELNGPIIIDNSIWTRYRKG